MCTVLERKVRIEKPGVQGWEQRCRHVYVLVHVAFQTEDRDGCHQDVIIYTHMGAQGLTIIVPKSINNMGQDTLNYWRSSKQFIVGRSPQQSESGLHFHIGDQLCASIVRNLVHVEFIPSILYKMQDVLRIVSPTLSSVPLGINQPDQPSLSSFTRLDRQTTPFKFL